MSGDAGGTSTHEPPWATALRKYMATPRGPLRDELLLEAQEVVHELRLPPGKIGTEQAWIGIVNGACEHAAALESELDIQERRTRAALREGAKGFLRIKPHHTAADSKADPQTEDEKNAVFDREFPRWDKTQRTRWALVRYRRSQGKPPYAPSTGAKDRDKLRLKMADRLIEDIQQLLADEEVKRTLRTEVFGLSDDPQMPQDLGETVASAGSSLGHLPALESGSSSPETPEQKLAPTRRRERPSFRQQWRSLPRWKRWPLIGATLICSYLVVSMAIVNIARAVYPEEFHPVSSTSPVLAHTSGEIWQPGWGPDRGASSFISGNDTEARFNDARPSRFDLFPRLHRDETWSVGQAPFMTLDGKHTSHDAQRLDAGEYEVVVRVQNSATEHGGEDIGEATLNLGILPRHAGLPDLQGIYAQLSAENAEAVWDGVAVTLACACRAYIAPDSVEFASDGLPAREQLPESVLSPEDGALIGYDDQNGTLPAGARHEVIVYATLVIDEY